MEIEKAIEIGKKLINKYCPEYKLKIGNMKREHGYCNYTNKTIALSKYYIINNTEESVTGTIIHEIAHALTRGDNHGKKWQAKCIELGGDGKRLSNKTNGVPKKWKYVCEKCGNSFETFRKSKRIGACLYCCNKHNYGEYDERFILKEFKLR